MKNHNLHMTTTQGDPEPPRDNDDDSSPSYEDVHNDGESGYGNMKD